MVQWIYQNISSSFWKNNNNKFQISFFDRLGPFSDIAAATIEELINKFYNYGSFEYSHIFEIIEWKTNKL